MLARFLPSGVALLSIGALIAANALVYRAVFTPEHVTATVLQGGEVLLKIPGRMILVDTGPDASIVRALGASLPLWQRKIPTVILTAADAQSRGGLPALASRYQVERTVRYGMETPYGASLAFGNIRLIIPAPHMVTLVYADVMRTFASSTPPGVYPL